MATPEISLEKTWEISPSNVITADQTVSGNAQNDRRKLLYGIKSKLINGSIFTVPATVKSSSNGSVANTSDNWTSENSITFSTSTGAARSWIVLDLGFLELLIDCVHSATGDRGTRINAYASETPYNTDGTTTARPTNAGPELQICTNASANDGSWDGTASTLADHNYVYHVWRSDDGEETMVVITLANVMISFWRFGRFGGSYPAVPDNNYYACLSPRSANSTEFATTDKLSDDGTGRFFMLNNSDVSVACLLNVPIVQLTNERQEIEGTVFRTKNSYDGTIPVMSAEILSTTVGWKTCLGKIKDVFLCPSWTNNSNTFPGTRDFISFGMFMLPWDGSIPVPS